MNIRRKGQVVLLALIAGCARQPSPLAPITNISGYEVQGTVTDQLGNPVPGVQIFMDYSANLVFTDSAATRVFYVSSSSQVQAVVVDGGDRLIRTLTPLQNFAGMYQVLWDGKDSTGSLPPSGIYYVQYLVGGAVKFSYSQLVSGGQVATTDVSGSYTIPMKFLPVDSVSIPYFSVYDSTFEGNLAISNNVILSFSYSNHLQQIERSLDKDQVTTINFVIQ